MFQRPLEDIPWASSSLRALGWSFGVEIFKETFVC